MKIKTREQYYGYLQRLQELMRDDLSTAFYEDLEFEELVKLISLYELETLPAKGEKMSIETGGPAFPVKMGCFEDGMSLRDYFAAEAMQAFMPSRPPPDEIVAEQIAEAAYFMADAMLRIRGRENENLDD